MNLSWSSRFIKYILFIFNFLFLISGIILIGVGVSVKAYYEEYALFLGSQYFSLPNLLIAIGALIFIISFLGCCGALKESWFMVFIFAILLSLIFILEFSAGIAGYVLRGDTTSYLTSVLSDTIPTYVAMVVSNNRTNPIVHMWDLIQGEFNCCGANGPKDWQNKFHEITNNSNSLPINCCRIIDGTILNMTCEIDNPSTPYYQIGCVEGFGDYIKDHAVTLGGVGLAIAVIQLFGVIFAFHLARRIKHSFYST